MPRLLLLSILACAAALAACGESEQDRARAEVCAARDDIAQQVEQLSTLTLTTATTTEVTDALAEIRENLTEIRDAQGQLSDDRRADVEAANEAFAETARQTVAAIGTTVSIEQAGTELRAALQQLTSSYRSTFGRLECP